MNAFLETIMHALDLIPPKPAADLARCKRQTIVSGKVSEAAHALNNATTILHASTIQAQKGADELNALVKAIQGKRQ